MDPVKEKLQDQQAADTGRDEQARQTGALRTAAALAARAPVSGADVYGWTQEVGLWSHSQRTKLIDKC